MLFMSGVCHAFAFTWSPAGKGLTSWPLFVRSNCDFVTFPFGILGQVWYLIVLIPDLCRISYFVYLLGFTGQFAFASFCANILLTTDRQTNRCF